MIRSGDVRSRLPLTLLLTMVVIFSAISVILSWIQDMIL